MEAFMRKKSQKWKKPLNKLPLMKHTRRISPRHWKKNLKKLWKSLKLKARLQFKNLLRKKPLLLNHQSLMSNQLSNKLLNQSLKLSLNQLPKLLSLKSLKLLKQSLLLKNKNQKLRNKNQKLRNKNQKLKSKKTLRLQSNKLKSKSQQLKFPNKFPKKCLNKFPKKPQLRRTANHKSSKKINNNDLWICLF